MRLTSSLTEQQRSFEESNQEHDPLYDGSKESFRDDEVTSEVSQTFTQMNTTGVKEENPPENTENIQFQQLVISHTEYEETDLPLSAANFSPSKREPVISQGEEEMDTSDQRNFGGVWKSARQVEHTHFFAFQNDSNMSGIIGSEHDTTDLDKNNLVTWEELEMNPELPQWNWQNQFRSWDVLKKQ